MPANSPKLNITSHTKNCTSLDSIRNVTVLGGQAVFLSFYRCNEAKRSV
jgi:hypothetical protein